MTPLTDFFEVIRLLLGDTEIYGCYAYPDADCAASVRQVFRMGQGPCGYLLNDARDSVTPSIPDGDKYAIVAYSAALLLVGGEEGAQSFRTRSLGTSQRGDRQRDLLQEFRQKIYEIETGGGLVFNTYQNLLGALQHISLGAFTEANVESPVTKVTL